MFLFFHYTKYRSSSEKQQHSLLLFRHLSVYSHTYTLLYRYRYIFKWWQPLVWSRSRIMWQSLEISLFFFVVNDDDWFYPSISGSFDRRKKKQDRFIIWSDGRNKNEDKIILLFFFYLFLLWEININHLFYVIYKYII